MSVTLNHQGVQRIRGEYLQMPGLRLKLDQVQRLCGVDRATGKMALDMLIAEEFLCRLRSAKADPTTRGSSADAA